MNKKTSLILVAAALLAGGFAAHKAAPGLMITTAETGMGFEESVAALEKSIKDNGWEHAGTARLSDSLEKKGYGVGRKVAVVKLCHPKHAQEVLRSDRYVSALMPCSVSVWEGDDGKVRYSKMNTGLIAPVFGGEVSRVMGGGVAADERRILEVFSGAV